MLRRRARGPRGRARRSACRWGQAASHPLQPLLMQPATAAPEPAEEGTRATVARVSAAAGESTASGSGGAESDDGIVAMGGKVIFVRPALYMSLVIIH